MRMMYKHKNFRSDTLEIIMQANVIIEEMQAQGYDLTLRQLYYQFVVRGQMLNTEQNYSRLSKVISDGRLAGMIDWDAIVDRTRYLRKTSTWDSPTQILETAAMSYKKDHWIGQDRRLQVWIEKDALIGVIEGTCNLWQVPYFSCRGYVSQSEMWNAGQRIIRAKQDHDQDTLILHLGDHDPSGIDMTRDIRDRLDLFTSEEDGYPDPEIKRIALNMDQVEEFNPPPNPVRLEDSRCQDYVAKYGNSSWELDALNPAMMSNLIADNITEWIDHDKWDAVTAEEDADKVKLNEIITDW